MMIEFNMQIELLVSNQIETRKFVSVRRDNLFFSSKKTIGQNTIRRNCTTKRERENENERKE